MAWTWSGSPATSDRDAVRYWIQDVDTTNQLLTDGELDYLLARYAGASDSVLTAAAAACDTLAVRYAGTPDVTADGVTVSLAQLSQRYSALAADLRAQRARDATDAVGTIDTSVIEGCVSGPDPSIRPLSFALGMHDNPAAGQQDFGGARLIFDQLLGQ